MCVCVCVCVCVVQAYCLKVKEMDDEEYEAAVSADITLCYTICMIFDRNTQQDVWCALNRKYCLLCVWIKF